MRKLLDPEVRARLRLLERRRRHEAEREHEAAKPWSDFRSDPVGDIRSMLNGQESLFTMPIPSPRFEFIALPKTTNASEITYLDEPESPLVAKSRRDEERRRALAQFNEPWRKK